MSFKNELKKKIAQIRVNEKIKAEEVRVVDEDGKQIGVMPLKEALKLAEERGVDLVEIAPNANPPVCKLIDFGKFKYQLEKKEREARKNQKSVETKEIQFNVNIDKHDFDYRIKHMREFLEEGNKVRVRIKFKGRESMHKELGYQLAESIQKALEDISNVEVPPKMEAGNIIMLLAPKPKKK